MLYFIIMGFLVQKVAGTTKKNLRLYAGEDDVLNQFDFTVLLQYIEPNIRFCTGNLLATNWVLTSAHCIEDQPPEDLGVRHGDFTTLETNKVARVLRKFLHPSFSNIHGINDIAVVLCEKIIGKAFVKILVVDHKTLFGLPVTFAGFGRTTEHLRPIYQHEIQDEQVVPLQVGHGIVIPCEEFEGFQFSTLCVAPKCTRKKQQARSGDSGGPLIYDGKIIGIARSYPTANGMSTTQYTPVCMYAGWVRNIVKVWGNHT